MAWIKSQQALRDHPKLKKLARGLEISIPTALGHLHMLWWWAMDYAQDGNLTPFDALDIADAAGWGGDPNRFVDAMVNCGFRGAGFLERTEDGELLMHDWDEHCGDEFERRAKEAERLRAYREKKKKSDEKVRTSDEPEAYAVRTPYETSMPEVRTPDEPGTYGVRGEEKRREEKRGDTPPISPPRGEGVVETANAKNQDPLAENSSEDGEGARSGTRRNGKGVEYTADFEAFFSAYPRRLRKQEAFATWERRKREGVDVEAVIAAATAYGKAMAYLGKGSDVILHPKTFLNENRWKDWLPPDGVAYLEARELAKRKAEYGRDGRTPPVIEPSPSTYEEAKALMERKERERGGPTTYEEAKAAMDPRLHANDNVIDADFRHVGDGET